MSNIHMEMMPSNLDCSPQPNPLTDKLKQVDEKEVYDLRKGDPGATHTSKRGKKGRGRVPLIT